jgi:hypothetical protein
MLLLTWHGTILRVEQENRRLTHAPPVPIRAIAQDFRVELPTDLTDPHPMPGGMEAIPGNKPRTLHLRRAGAYLAVEPHAAFPICTRPSPGDWETLLALTEAEAETLRRLLSGGWSLGGITLARATLRLDEGFALRLGDHALDLTASLPVQQPDGSVLLELEAGSVVLHPVPAEPEEPEWHLRAAPPEHKGRTVTTTAEFQATPGTRLDLPAVPERMYVPLTAHRADADWMYRDPWAGHDPQSGLHLFGSTLVHEADRYVLLQRAVEGMIFGPDGVSNTQGYIGNLTGAMPPNFAREANETFISTAALRTAPRLRGPHAVFYGGNLTNYFHWIIDAMVPLSLLRPHLPAETTLLLPGTLAEFRAHPNGQFDHVAMLEAFGFGDMPRVEVNAQVCHVEDVYWADKCFIEDIAAADLDVCRRRALDRLPPPGPANRLIYIKRTTSRRVSNGPGVEELLRKSGFEIHVMEDLTVAQQIDLFRHAAFVIGVHGAALANLVFCPPGTKVIELAPDCGYRPFFAQISSKLGLVHGIIPCPTHDGGFFGHVTVPPERLRAMRRMLERRL